MGPSSRERNVIFPLLLLVFLAACDPVAPSDADAWLTGFNFDDDSWAALDTPCPTDAPAHSLPEAEREALPPVPEEPRTLDVIFAELAAQVPGGFGGFYYVEQRLTLYLVDPAAREQAIASLRELAPEAGFEHIVPELSDAAVWHGRWDFAQLYDWYRYLAPHVWAIEGVHMSDIAENRNRIEYGVLDDSARQRLTRVLIELDIPCFLVAIEIRDQAVAL